jgi:diguanylate cyclase (GGDEF)-like protein
MRILYKLLLSFFAIVLIIGITSFIVVRASHRALRKEIGETAVAMTVQIVREIDKRIFERIDHFQEFIVSKYLRDIVARSNMDFEKMDNVQGFIDDKDHEWTSMPRGTITPFMQELLENDLSDTLRKKIGFYNSEYNYKVYGEVFVTNKFGANVAQTGKTSDYKQDDEEWWQSAKRDNFYMKDIAYDESAGVHSTDISLKIDDEKGNFIGVVKVVLNIEDTFQYMRQSAVSERYRDVKFILTTKQGKNIYSSRGDKLLVDYSKDDFFTAADGDMGFLDLSGGKTGQYGDLFSYARSKGFGWILFSEYKSDELFAPLNRLNKRLSVLAVGIFFLSLILSYLIARTISRPIERLKIAAHDIGDGKLETKIDIHTKDEIGELASVLGRMTDELKHLATTDRLTQTYNRMKFEEIMPMEMDRARRYHRLLSVSFFDIDDFKKVNDTYGHSAGDHVLKTMADIVKKNIRKTTYLFRWGGEEFIIVIPEADINGAGILAERIRKAIEDYRFEGVGTVTVSFGITQFKEEDTADSLLKRADAAVYQAKANGRNRIGII